MYLTGTEMCSLGWYITLQKKWKTSEVCHVEVWGLQSLRCKMRQEGELSVHRPATTAPFGAAVSQAREGGQQSLCFQQGKGTIFSPAESDLRHNRFLKIASFLHQNLSWSLVICGTLLVGLHSKNWANYLLTFAFLIKYIKLNLQVNQATITNS